MMESQHFPFTLPPLPYAYDALEPYIDRETMQYHHDKHFQTYIDNLNKILLNAPAYQEWTLEQLLRGLPRLPGALRTPVRSNAGGVWNHDLYFDSLAPQTGALPDNLRTALQKHFGSLDAFAGQLRAAALGVFGAGYAFLVRDGGGALRIVALPNQDTPLSQGMTALLPLDVWEHAYYLKHKNRRDNYVADWFSVVNWPRVAARLLR